MATASEELLDRSISHQIGLQRYSNSVVRQMIGLLNKVDDDIVRQLLKYDPTATTGTWSQRRLEKLLESVRAINVEAYAVLQRELDSALSDLAAYEAEFQRRMLQAALPIDFNIVTPPSAQLFAAVRARPFQGRFLREWYSGLEQAAQRRLREAIQMGFVEGETIDQMVRRVRGTKAQKYRDGILEVSRRGAAGVVRTAVNHTATVARNETYKQNSSVVKSVKWVSTLDARTTLICASRDGKVYPVDEGPRPPAHFNCLPGDSLVTSSYGVTGASKRWYNGQLVVIRTSAGKYLACTPNHPILTDAGWVAAHDLMIGDNVVCDGGAEWGASAINMNHKNVPTAIEEVAEATFRALKVRTRPVPTSAEDFHGDGVDGDIAIVASDCFLEDRLTAALYQQCGDGAFVMRNTDLSAFARKCGFAPMFFTMSLATNRIVSGLRQFAAFIRRCAVHASGLLFGPISKRDAFVLQNSFDGAGRALKMVGYTPNADARVEHTDDIIDRKMDARLPCAGAAGFVSFIESAKDRGASDAQLASDILSGATGPVFLDDIVHIEMRDFSGHVFNLETEKGFYVANGIITHNCRSTTAPVLKSWKEMGINLREAPEGTRASMNGQVPSSTTYNAWLRKQPVSVQNDVLGETKARLFRKGELPIDRFVDRNGNEYTLDELRRREAEAFERAGL